MRFSRSKRTGRDSENDQKVRLSSISSNEETDNSPSLDNSDLLQLSEEEDGELLEETEHLSQEGEGTGKHVVSKYL